MRRTFKDITGQKFGRLTVLILDTKQGAETHVWKCRCDCGSITHAQGSALRGGRWKSCGCLQIESATKHGMGGTPTYESWKKMKYRCLSPSDAVYDRYGGRGIKVCKRWLSFENFLADMGEKPKGLSLDRIDNDGDYKPSNCRWASFRTQNNNRRSSRILTIDGETKTVTQWIGKSGLSKDTVWGRLRTGWDPKAAISVPNITGRPAKPRGARPKSIHK
jgi:hypothetical protein